MKVHLLSLVSFAAILQAASSACAITPAELAQQQAAGSKITIIDCRSNEQFQKSHIPGAINIPATLLPQKRLPSLGRVVVYDEGLGRNAADGAVAALNAKPGIQAEALEGGFSAWETARATTTAPRGMDRESIPSITYEQLKKANSTDVVLVDLRKGPKAGKSAAVQSGLTDLAREFPNAPVAKSAFALPQQRQGSSKTAAPLLVLIDSGDGTAQEVARSLKAAGNSRYVVLAGGEEIIARHGKTGLQRQGVGQQASPINAQPQSTR